LENRLSFDSRSQNAGIDRVEKYFFGSLLLFAVVDGSVANTGNPASIFAGIAHQQLAVIVGCPLGILAA
jgi:hypothetical protein